VSFHHKITVWCGSIGSNHQWSDPSIFKINISLQTYTNMLSVDLQYKGMVRWSSNCIYQFIRGLWIYTGIIIVDPGGTSQINKISLVVHMWSCTCVPHGWNQLLILVYVTWSYSVLLINALIVHTWYRKKQSSETVNKELSHFTTHAVT